MADFNLLQINNHIQILFKQRTFETLLQVLPCPQKVLLWTAELQKEQSTW